jgi:hypothetical protein
VDGRTYYYECSDNLLNPRWKQLSPAAAITATQNAELTFDHTRRTGIVLHMLPGLPLDGRVGAVAIADHPTAAHEKLCAVTDVLNHAAAPA